MVKNVPFVLVISFTDTTVNYLTENNIPAFYYSIVVLSRFKIMTKNWDYWSYFKIKKMIYSIFFYNKFFLISCAFMMKTY